MEGVKEKWRQEREEKDSNEAEEDGRRSDNNDEEEDESSEVAALVWQEGYDEDNLSFPIMHWEALSLRIAELEKQEELKKEQKAKVRGYWGSRGRVQCSTSRISNFLFFTFEVHLFESLLSLYLITFHFLFLDFL